MCQGAAPEYSERLAYGTDQGRWLASQMSGSAPRRGKSPAAGARAFHNLDELAPAASNGSEQPLEPLLALHRARSRPKLTPAEWAVAVAALLLLFFGWWKTLLAVGLPATGVLYRRGVLRLPRRLLRFSNRQS